MEWHSLLQVLTGRNSVLSRTDIIDWTHCLPCVLFRPIFIALNCAALDAGCFKMDCRAPPSFSALSCAKGCEGVC
eukprot:4899065-Alexandrium_andersonii.AAC.1